MKVLVEAYGCSLNRGEAAELVSLLADAGFKLTTVARNVDAAVIFTCDVIETTERKMFRRIVELTKISEKLIICGCLGDMAPQKIKKLAPDAEVLSAAEHLRVVDLLKMGGGKKRKIFTGMSRIAITGRCAVAILPIATGCKGSCTYCVTRFARGTLKSRTPFQILTKAKRLVARGAAEVQVCCQDTAIYGEDIGADLNALISSLNSLAGDFMLRVGMMNPKNAMKNLDSVLKAYEHEKVFKFLHLPVQTGSDKILALMRRGHTVQDFKVLVRKFRKNYRNGSVSTDIIIGFPNETENDFKNSLDLIREIKPDIVNVTRFSARPRTLAYKMPEKVPGWVAKNRSRELTKLRFEISKRNNEAFEGKIVRALATERRRPGTTFLRTIDYRPVVVSKCVAMGKWYKIMITGSTRTHLLGVII